eukprot:scaffold34239_cov101-Isochrysis_galbana.AAC.1
MPAATASKRMITGTSSITFGTTACSATAPLTWGLGAARRSDLRSTLKSVLRLREHAKQEHYSGGDTANMPSRVVGERKRVGSPILSTWRVCV